MSGKLGAGAVGEDQRDGEGVHRVDLRVERGVRRERQQGAPGEEWIDATKKNICAPDKDNTQRTIEGYVFKSADSIEIARIGEVDMKQFPFLLNRYYH